jgi:ribonuclease T2
MRLALTLVAFLALTGCVAREAEVATGPAPECAVPADVTPAPVEVGPADKVVADFTPDSYLLSLAWQPEACRGQAADTSDPSACDGGRTWTLHGLWPNSDDGKHPRFCRPSQTISEATTAAAFCMIPSARLQQHEWAAHGTCAWDSPEAYFDRARALWQGLRKPELTTPTLTAGALRDAFVAANPDLPRGAIAVANAPEGQLRELRICHDLAFKPAACAPKALGARDEVVLTITPPN